MTAYAIAQQRFREQTRRIQRVQLARAKPVKAGAALRPAAQVPFTPRPISILKPVADTPDTIRRFVQAEFAEAARKRDTTR